MFYVKVKVIGQVVAKIAAKKAKNRKMQLRKSSEDKTSLYCAK